MKTAIRTILFTVTAGLAILAGAGEAGALEIVRTSANELGDLTITFVEGTAGRPLGVALNYDFYEFHASYDALWVCATPDGKTLSQPRFHRHEKDIIKRTWRLQASPEEQTVSLSLDPSFVHQKEMQCPIGYAPELNSVSYDQIQILRKGHPVAEGQPITWGALHLEAVSSET